MTNRSPLQRRQRGVTTAEYAVVMLSLLVVWKGLPQVLSLIKQAFESFSWALMLPF